MDSECDTMDTPESAPRRRSVLLALSWYDHRVHQGVARFAERAGWHLDARMANSNEPVWGWRGDGVICKLGCGSVDEELLRFAQSLDLPTVDLSVFGPAHGIANLEFDPAKIGAMAVAHFLERGFRHFAWYPQKANQPFELRRQGYREALAREGLTAHDIVAIDTQDPARDWQEAERELGRQLRELPQPLAVFAFNDEWAAQVLRACERVGLAVPEQVAVLGVDNQQLICEHLPIPLSSIHLDLEHWAEQAAAALDAMMDGGDAWRSEPAQTTWLGPRDVVARRSTDVLATGHDGVARAIAFIAANYKLRIGVDDIAAASGLSRSGLKQAFRRHLRRSINDEVQRVRLRAARELLVDTDWTMEHIAEEVGVGDSRNLFRLFARAERVTPSEYRRTHRAQGSPSPGAPQPGG